MTPRAHASAFWRSRWVIINLVLLLPVLLHSAWRDIQMEESHYTVDLRNRIVGARLQKDGRLPYFFHWEDKGDPRYADPFSRGNKGPNAMTASPFFHELLMPFCDLPEKQLVRFWLILSWLLLASMAAMAITMARDDLNKLMLLNLAALFTHTEGWKMHIAVGQLYLFVAFLMTAVICLFLRGRKTSYVTGGLAAAMLMLCRPIALIIGLPFLPRLKTYRMALIATAFFLFAYGFFVCASPFERAVWSEYRQALAAHVAYHQTGPFFLGREIRPDRKLAVMEGIDFSLATHPPARGGPYFFSENGNIFQLYEMIFRRHMPLWLLNGLLLGSLLAMELMWFRKCKTGSPPAWQFPVLAWTFYMMVEIFSPVHRNQYNTVEWLPLLFTFAAFLNFRRVSPALVLLAAGLILNISNAPWLLMRHTIGEFCWLAAGLSLVLPQQKKNPSLKTAVIMGAGPRRADRRLRIIDKNEIKPVIIETENQVGGLSRTIDYKGNGIDIGGHRFFSRSEKIVRWWLGQLPLDPSVDTENLDISYQHQHAVFSVPEEHSAPPRGKMLLRPRKSRIYFNKTFFDYPLSLNRSTLLNFGMVKLARIAASYTKSKFFPLKKESNLEDFFINRFGRELYSTFFKAYTEKVWGVSCTEIPADWGRQRIKDLNIGKALRQSVRSVFINDKSLHQKNKSTSLIEQFLYPEKGPGQLWDAVAERIRNLGGEIRLGCSVDEAVLLDDRMIAVEYHEIKTAQRTRISGDYFFLPYR